MLVSLQMLSTKLSSETWSHKTHPLSCLFYWKSVWLAIVPETEVRKIAGSVPGMCPHFYCGEYSVSIFNSSTSE